MITFKPILDISLPDIYEAFCLAFSDYSVPLDMTRDQFEYMITRRGFNPEISTGAFSGRRLVGFTLNGLRHWQGRKTAYDVLTGIIKEYRGMGIGKKIFSESLPVLEKAGARQYILEVIQSNTAAVNLYGNLGFEITRELLCFTTSPKDIRLSKTYNGLQTHVIAPEWNRFKQFWDHEPSWQNSMDSIIKKLDSFKIVGAFSNDTLTGYGVIQKDNGDIPQLAVDKSFRRLGTGSCLLAALMIQNGSQDLRMINVPGHDSTPAAFLKSLNLSVMTTQYEMSLQL